MFEFVRKHSKIFMGLMFLLIVPSFILLGVDGYTRNATQTEAVARVDGQDITRAEWDAAHARVAEELRATNPMLDSKQLDSPQARYISLERLVSDRVLLAAAAKSRLTTSDTRLARALQEDPAITSLRRADGTLDMDRYRALVGRQGMTPEMFENRVRGDLSSRQVLQGIAAGSIVPSAQADVTLAAYFEQREIQTAVFKAADFVSKVTVTDAEIEAYYKSNQAQFHVPERASIEYVVLDLDSVKKSITVNETELKDYYQQNLERFAGKEERKARHILVNAPKSASDAERKEARAKADQLLADVRKNPASFADVAAKNSQDTGSAASGGDLGFFTRGAMVKPFEDAAFALKKNEISDIVESDFGFHIIQVTDIKTPPARSFEEMRPTLEAEFRQQTAQRKFAESAEAFTNGVFEQADSLKPVAQRLGLPIQTATVGAEPQAGAKGALASKRFLESIFSADSVEKKRNTEAVEIGTNQLAAGRVVQHMPAHTQALAEIKDQVRQQVVQQKAAELAKKEGAMKLAAWAANPTSASLQAPVLVSRVQTQCKPSQIVDAALHASTAKLPTFVGADLGADGYAVVKVNKVVPYVPATSADAARDRGGYAQAWSAAEAAAYYDLLKDRLKVQFLVPKPETALKTPG